VIYIYIYFSDVSTLFFMVLLRRSRRFDLLLHLYGGTLQHTFLHFFQKSNFQKFFGPFPRAAGAFAHHFRIPLLPLSNLKFFPTFLPHFFMVLLRRSRRFDFYIYTAAPHNTHTHTHFLYFFQKSNF